LNVTELSASIETVLIFLSGFAGFPSYLQHEETPQCIGLSLTGPGHQHPDGSLADQAPIVKLGQSDEAARSAVWAGQRKQFATI